MEHQYFPRLLVRITPRIELLQLWWRRQCQPVPLPEMFVRVLETIGRRHARRILLNLRKLPPLDSAAQAWLQEHWSRQLSRTSVRRVALLMPSNPHNRIIIESLLWLSGQRQLSYEVQYFAELPAALDWLTDAEIASTEQDWPRRRREPLLLRVRRRACPRRVVQPA